MVFEAASSGAPLAEPWRVFTAAAQEVGRNPPLHLAMLLNCVATIKRGANGRPVVILDHGCGGGRTIMTLVVLGYPNVFGVDVGDSKCASLNRIMSEVLGDHETRFSTYDGTRLPLPDQSIDFVFSQQVLEHVGDDVLDAYYSEEGRVLRPGGRAYHQVPHRWSPYDSHTRTWLVHWLPRSLQRAVYRRLGLHAEYLDGILRLRAPSAHFKRVERFIGPCQDLTLARLAETPDEKIYEGSLRLRRAIRAAVRMPVLGSIAGAVLARLTMLDTLATRR